MEFDFATYSSVLERFQLDAADQEPQFHNEERESSGGIKFGAESYLKCECDRISVNLTEPTRAWGGQTMEAIQDCFTQSSNDLTTRYRFRSEYGTSRKFVGVESATIFT